MSSEASPSRREQNRLELREQVLEAARQLFTTRGPENVTMAEVAERAGVARASVFNHFSSKHALVEAITEDVFAYYRAMLATALADETTPTPDLVRALFEQMGAGIEAYHGFYRGVFREIARIQVGLDEGAAGERVRGQALHLLEKLMARGLERGDLRRDHAAAELAAAFDALSNGTITHWLYEDRSGSLRARMRRAAEILLGPVATDPAAGRGASLPLLFPPDQPVPNRGLPPVESSP